MLVYDIILIYDSEALRNLLLILYLVLLHVLIYINISVIRAKIITLIERIRDYYIFKSN